MHHSAAAYADTGFQLTDSNTPLLSDLMERGDRRAFLARASALSLAIPGMAAALTSCAPGEKGASDTAQGTASQGPSANRAAVDSLRRRNSDSKLDSTLLKGRRHGNSSATGEAATGAQAAKFSRFDPVLPPLPQTNRLKLDWHAREVPVRISDDTVVAAWTFEGSFPGTVVHCRVGDT